MQSIEKDSSFALALTGLAETYVLSPLYGVAPQKDSMPQAEAAILSVLWRLTTRSLKRTPRVVSILFFEYDRTGSEREFRRTIELNPKYATAHHWQGLDFLVLTKIAMLEKDVEERSSYVVTSGIELALDELRDDSRFRDLQKRMKLPE